jgi:DNA polymerase-1
MFKIAKKISFRPRRYTCVQNVTELEEKMRQIRSIGAVTFKTFCSDELHENSLYGISFCVGKDQTFYVPLITEKQSFKTSIDTIGKSPYYQIVQNLFQDDSIKKVAHDVKANIKNLAPYGIDINNFDDVMVMAYVLYCGRMGNDLDVLTERILEKQLEYSEKDILGMGQKKKTWIETPLDLVSKYVNQFSNVSHQLYGNLTEALHKQPRLTQFYNTIERPLIATLAKIELQGVFVDQESFAQMEKEYSEKIQTLEQQIHQITENSELNINSPHQIGQILVEKFGVKDIKKSAKTDKYLTDSETLEQVQHPLAKMILEYRNLSKMYSTYIVGFQKHINPYDGRIHTTFQNALTVTGRLSSTGPNLQNIPNRSAEGRKIRHNIIAPPNHVLIKADYSQVELRILAHVANIQVLKDAFKNGKDVHSITAQQVFQVDQVSKELRQKAKAINFGIIYGMSEFGLSKQINVPVKQAKEYIKQYFTQYPGIEKYMKNTKQFCHDHGFVNTLFGRKCWIPDINSDIATKRGFSERTAINTPIQGTSADITKIAMIRLGKEFEKLNMKTRMILQVHDEVVFEAPLNEVDRAKEIIKNIMEGVGDSVNFSVPLTVDVSVSERWCE